jgi:hypothetical protein
MLPDYEVADILNRNKSGLKDIVNSSWQLRTLYALSACRTALLGGHIDKCSNKECGHIQISYNSCRNRHCPKCQGHKRDEWIHKRESELLKVPYYHIVFTLPNEFNRYALFKPKLIYGLLFKVAWSVIKDFAANPKFMGANTGMISILHTWGQNLSLHPHLHCIVPGGGLINQKWKSGKGKDKYLFPVKAMSKVFRARFVEQIRKQINLDKKEAKALFSKNWVVYCKRPFFGAEQVIEYLGRYTHKIAISNHRIKNIENASVTFSAKDYRHGGKKHLVTLADTEFIRRFSLHILPKGFTRIRHYGILSSSLKKISLKIIEAQIGEIQISKKELQIHRMCPRCRTHQMQTIFFFDNRGPPVNIKAILNTINKTSRKFSGLN